MRLDFADHHGDHIGFTNSSSVRGWHSFESKSERILDEQNVKKRCKDYLLS